MKKFLEEIWNRIFHMKSPSFFIVIQWASGITAGISGIPALIAQFQNDLHIALPVWMIDYSNKMVVIGAIVAWVIAKLPVSNDNATTLKDGVVKPMLPFTKK